MKELDRLKLKSTGRIYIIWKESVNGKGETIYYCNIDKDGKAFGSTRIFKKDKIELLNRIT